jgi:RNA polymerase sigma factor (sigma-70 family)
MQTAQTAPKTLSDLTARIGAGDAGAESALIERTSRELLRMLRRMTRDKALSDDLHQETFRIVLGRLRGEGLAEPGKVAGFILRTGRNLALGHHRSHLREGTPPAEPPEDVPDPAPGQLDGMLLRERSAMVRRLLAELTPDRDRQILTRLYLAGEDKRRICADLGLGALHFNRVLFRAHQRLRKLAAERRVR